MFPRLQGAGSNIFQERSNSSRRRGRGQLLIPMEIYRTRDGDALEIAI